VAKMNYVVQVTLTIKVGGSDHEYRTYTRVNTLPCTSENDAKTLAEAINMTEDRSAEICVSVPKRRGSVILPLDQVHNVAAMVEHDRHQASQDQQDREASVAKPYVPVYRKPLLSRKPAEPQPGDDN